MKRQPSGFSPWDDLSFVEKMQTVTGLAYFPALTILVFLRWRLGYRRVKLSHLIFMAMLLVGLGSFGPELPALASRTLNPFYRSPTVFGIQMLPKTGIGLFGVAMLVIGAIQNRIQRQDIGKGVRWHTFSMGISWFERLQDRLPFDMSVAIPSALARAVSFALPSRISLRPSSFIVHRYIDPLICITIGYAISSSLPLLSGWLLFSSLCLAAFEQVLFDKQLDQNLDVLDSLEPIPLGL